MGEAWLTAAILHAGKTSIIIPCIGDLSLWAWTLHHMGVATWLVEKGLLWEGGKAMDLSKIGDRIGCEVSALFSLLRRTTLTLALL